jgi:CRP-like cAMP-binding protein
MHPSLHSYVVEEMTYSDREVIIEEGSKGSWIYVILEGIAKVKKRTPKGMVTVDVLREGEVFGEMAFLEGGTSNRSASVIAADGEVRVGLLDTEKLINDYEAVPSELKTLIRSLMQKLRNTTSKVCSIIVAK